MATYAIGDVQGCFDELMALLNKINFHPTNDRLWFCGDLVNRGPKSLEVLRFLKSLETPPVIILGNHDFHLLAVADEVAKVSKKDTLDAILNSKDKEELCHWLRSYSLIHHDKDLGFVMTHAGIYPQWDLATAKRCASEVSQILQSDNRHQFYHHMYDNEPSFWDDNLNGWGRSRFITNAFTRMRFCSSDGKLELTRKGKIGTQPPGYLPWFALPSRKSIDADILFGHWAALGACCDEPHVFPLDTGCVWGGKLTAMRLEDKVCFSVVSQFSFKEFVR